MLTPVVANTLSKTLLIISDICTLFGSSPNCSFKAVKVSLYDIALPYNCETTVSLKFSNALISATDNPNSFAY